ncbi:MAG: hypothetical protein RRY55_05525 [Bacteroidales bacterium]
MILPWVSIGNSFYPQATILCLDEVGACQVAQVAITDARKT